MGDISNYLTDISAITYLVVFIGGVATSFTPCIYPLIPIIVGVIGSSQEKSRGRNFILSFSYVLGMALTFSILGMVAAMTGRLFGQVQSSPLAHIIVGSIIILFALALLNVIPLPTFSLNRAGAGRVKQTGSIPAVFFMGLASGFITVPCTVAISGALLAFVATTQNIIFGFSLLFTFALGIGVLLILIGTFAGILTGLPKAKKWMRIIQKALALAMILLGGYFIFKATLL
ncbi:MAG: sulfite exporter TauE/SafE family protein [Candidatus Omnitrophica bacterium]|nr:sulfite exporter TauE/SafE family protein [Candidatus Omnitrophota bacterium]